MAVVLFGRGYSNSGCLRLQQSQYSRLRGLRKEEKGGKARQINCRACHEGKLLYNHEEPEGESLVWAKVCQNMQWGRV